MNFGIFHQKFTFIFVCQTWSTSEFVHILYGVKKKKGKKEEIVTSLFKNQRKKLLMMLIRIDSNVFCEI